ATSDPYAHFAASPHCRVRVSRRGRARGAGGCPTIVAGIISPARVKKIAAVNSAPDDHFAAGPHCRVNFSGSGRVGGAGGCPTVGAGIVSPASVQNAAAVTSAPDDYFAAAPYCGADVCSVVDGGGVCCATVCGW